MKRVLIAVDDSEESHDAARFVSSLLGNNAEYVVMSVANMPLTVLPFVDPIGGAYIPPTTIEETVVEEAHHAEAVVETVAKDIDVDYKHRVETGDAAEAICRVAKDESFDLIVIGSHDRSWFGKLLSRSVRDYLVEHAPCPVLVVR